MSIKNRITKLENEPANKLGYDGSYPVYIWRPEGEPPPDKYPGLVIKSGCVSTLDKYGNRCGNEEAVTVETQYPDRVEQMPWNEWRESQG